MRSLENQFTAFYSCSFEKKVNHKNTQCSVQNEFFAKCERKVCNSRVGCVLIVAFQVI